MLVQIEPFTTPETFLENYGVNVRTMAELVKRGLVIPIISSDLHRYVGLEYLAPLLTCKPVIVASIRTRHFFLLHSPAYDGYIDTAKERLSILRSQSKEWQRKYQTGGDAFITARAKRYARVKVLHPECADDMDEAIESTCSISSSSIDTRRRSRARWPSTNLISDT
jgi:hypothetical protein